MRDNNPLNNFETGSYSGGFKDVAVTNECPTFSQAVNPLKFVDFIGCHKLLLIILLGIVVLLFYSGAKAKAAAGGPSGKPGADTPSKK